MAVDRGAYSAPVFEISIRCDLDGWRRFCALIRTGPATDDAVLAQLAAEMRAATAELSAAQQRASAPYHPSTVIPVTQE